MSSASLAVVRRAHPDMVRVAALSAAITVNLAALMFALRPLAPQIANVFEPVKSIAVDIVEPPPRQPPPPDIIVKPLVKPLPVAAPVVHQHVSPPVAPPTTEPSHNTVPVSPPVAPPAVAPPSIAPGVVSLAYRAAPLRFPSQALRTRMQGTVLLRVLVDETGKPVDVVIEHSSGYGLLDKSARDQVLANWRFQPAEIDGHAVKAWARVPVSFLLQDM